MSRTMDLRQPIDLKLLGLLVRAAKYVIPDRFLQLCIAAMFMLAFHGFLRIGEITVRPGVVAEHVIKRSDLVIVPARDGVKSSLQLTIRHAKHQHVGRPIVLEINSQSHNCAVVHICRYLHTRGSSPGPLFCFPRQNTHIFHLNYQHVFLMRVTTPAFTNVIHLEYVLPLLQQRGGTQMCRSNLWAGGDLLLSGVISESL